MFSGAEKRAPAPGRGTAGAAGSQLTCREVGLGVDGGSGGQERRLSHKEGAEGALGEERRALLCRNVLAAAHAAVDLKVQGFAFLLGSEMETEKEERQMYPCCPKLKAGGPIPSFLQTRAGRASCGLLCQEAPSWALPQAPGEIHGSQYPLPLWTWPWGPLHPPHQALVTHWAVSNLCPFSYAVHTT